MGLVNILVQYTNLCLKDGILNREHHIEPIFETVTQMLVTRGRVSKIGELVP